MSATASTMLALGTPAPAFTLPSVADGRLVSLLDFAGDRALLIVFLCAHCPFVLHIAAELARLGQDFQANGLGIAAITANDVAGYPEDAPERTARFARQSGWTFPVLFDETQDIAQAYTAACTPDFFLFDESRKLVYRGQLDDSRPGRGTADGRDLRAALRAVLSGGLVNSAQKPSIGCNIKWRAGHEPVYFKKKL